MAKVGRPKKYDDAALGKELDAMYIYLSSPAMWHSKIPLKSDFCVQRGYPSDYLSRWADKSEEFKRALKNFQDCQEREIVRGVNLGKFDRTFMIFTLKNICGWRDAQSVEMSGPMPLTILLGGEDENRLKSAQVPKLSNKG